MTIGAGAHSLATHVKLLGRLGDRGDLLGRIGTWPPEYVVDADHVARIGQGCRVITVRDFSLAVDDWLLHVSSSHKITSVAYVAIVRTMATGSSCPCSLTGSLLRSRKYSM